MAEAGGSRGRARRVIGAVAGVVVLAIALWLIFGPGPPGILESARWAVRNAPGEDVVLLHVMMDADSPSQVAEGAFLINYHRITDDRDGLEVELAPVNQLVDVFRSLGVSNHTRVVVIGDPAHVAGRVFVTLDYLGHGDMTTVVDGGIEAWKAAGGAVLPRASGGVAAAKGRPVYPSVPGTFEATINENVLVTADWIEARLDDPSVTLVDARQHGEYRGWIPGRRGLAAGHLPGAYNMYWEDLLVEGDVPVMLPEDDVRARFDEAGAGEDGIVVNYCLVGMRASYTYMVSRHLGYDARFYDGSWNEWGARPRRSIAGGRGSRSR
ncbi:MAG: sulfurtransferase [Gemmatimonadetes bacterium]|nr:sulfurtransferase [Gemmatimonadota bacterium]